MKQVSEIEIVPYQPSMQAEWDAFVRASKNATFMLERGYMDYHSHRFTDCSLVLRKAGKIVALMPANRDGEVRSSHSGLTYAGFVVGDEMTAATMLESMDAVLTRWKTEGAKQFHYKAIPHIYHRIPAEEDLYALFVAGAKMVRRDVSVAIPFHDSAKMAEGTRYLSRNVFAKGMTFEESSGLDEFWALLGDGLRERHQAKPVHSLEEMHLLQSRFPKNIRLFSGTLNGRMIAGVLVYDCGSAVHSQYIASSEEGKKLGAVPGVVVRAMAEKFPAARFWDFGHSNEDGGTRLNSGLIAHKESYGGRAVVYDQYVIDLAAYQPGQCTKTLFTWKTR